MSKTPTNDTPKDATRNCGGQPGNRNNMRHGLRAGQLPKDAKYIELRLNAFRRTLEDAVVAAKGSVSLIDAGCIQTCLRWERHACLAQRWLVKAGDTLKPTDRLAFSREIARASAERDKALAALGIDKKENIWDALYEPVDEETEGESNDEH